MLQLVDLNDGFEAATTSPPAPATSIKRPLAVLKFGSSVLRDSHDLPRVAGEIYRQSLLYDRLIVVVSAYAGQTDHLFERLEEITAGSQCDGGADLISLGEELTASQLRLSCSRLGLDATVVRPEQWGIIASGPCQQALPIEVEEIPPSLLAKPIIIIPGFVALNEEGTRVLLGRGGSDFSALFVAGELEAECVRLYKDVDGVYDHDPADGGRDLHRYDQIAWGECLKIARPLLQPSAIEYAKAKSLPLEVGRIGSNSPTLVAKSTRQTSNEAHGAPLRIGLAGFGVVGQALYWRLLREPDFEIVSILVRDTAKPRSIYPPFELTNDPSQFSAEPFDILVDATCGEDAGLKLSRLQLKRGRHVVSANKTVIEPRFDELSRLARRTSGQLGYSACVGGGTAILETIANARRHGSVNKVTAVLNGTVNFLLDELAQGQPFEAALAKAQTAGFAEADPSQDLSGRDAEIKLRLIARSAFGVPERDIFIRSAKLTSQRIEKIQASGKRWIQLATIERARNCAMGSIGYVLADSIPALPALPGEFNFARLALPAGQHIEISGRGAGGAPTAEAIVTDLFAILQRQRSSEAEAKRP